MRRTKTTKQIKDDIIKYQLMQRALETQQYYRDGVFDKKLLDSLDDARTPQGLLYDKISDLGLRISSELYPLNTPAGITYREQTIKDIKDFANSLQRTYENGMITPMVFTNLVAFADNVFRTAFSQQPQFKTVNFNNTQVGKVISSLVNMSQQLLGNQNLDALAFDVKNINELLQRKAREEAFHQQLIQAQQIQPPVPVRGRQPARRPQDAEELDNEGELPDLIEDDDDDVQPIPPVQVRGRQARRKPQDADELDNEGELPDLIDDDEHIQQPALTSISSHRVGERVVNNYQQRMHSPDTERKKPADADQHPDHRDNTLDYLVSNNVISKKDLFTDHYGLRYGSATALNKIMKKLMQENLDNQTTPETWEDIVKNAANQPQLSEDFNKTKFIANYSKSYREAYNQIMSTLRERLNDDASNARQDEQDYAKSVDALQQQQSAESGTGLRPFGVNEAQVEQSKNSIPLLEQTKIRIENLKKRSQLYRDVAVPLLDAYVDGKILKSNNSVEIEENQRITMDAINHAFSAPAYAFFERAIESTLRDARSYSIPNITQEQQNDLVNTFKQSFTTPMLELIKNQLGSPDQYSKPLDKYQVKEAREMLNSLIKKFKEAEEGSPLAYEFKKFIDASNMPVELMYPEFIKNKRKQTSMIAIGKSSKPLVDTRRRQRRGDVVPLPVAESAKTRRVPQSSNSYTVGNTTYLRE